MPVLARDRDGRVGRGVALARGDRLGRGLRRRHADRYGGRRGRRLPRRHLAVLSDQRGSRPDVARSDLRHRPVPSTNSRGDAIPSINSVLEHLRTDARFGRAALHLEGPATPSRASMCVAIGIRYPRLRRTQGGQNKIP